MLGRVMEKLAFHDYRALEADFYCEYLDIVWLGMFFGLPHTPIRHNILTIKTGKRGSHLAFVRRQRPMWDYEFTGHITGKSHVPNTDAYAGGCNVMPEWRMFHNPVHYNIEMIDVQHKHSLT